MLGKIRAVRRWSLWSRLTITGMALVVASILQMPLEQEMPGEPFLLFFLIVIGATLSFGGSVGFAGVGLSAFLSLYFFEPYNTLAINHAADLIKVELYAILAGGCVVSAARLANALIAAGDEGEFFRRMEAKKSLLLRELAHGVANNFATIAALLRMKSATVSDADARSALGEAIEQVVVMGRVHRQLRADGQKASLDSAAFFQGLCDDLRALARGRPLAIECKSDTHQFPMDQAIVLGLIVNELVTNAVKHAFPCGRAGRVRIGFEALEDQLRLTVEDDGVGIGPPNATEGQGQDLVRGLLQQVDGKLEVESSSRGSLFRISIPGAGPGIMLPQSC